MQTIKIESRINSWESLSDVICAPAVDIPNIFYIYRKNGQEVEVKVNDYHKGHKYNVWSDYTLTAEEKEYIKNLRTNKALLKQ